MPSYLERQFEQLWTYYYPNIDLEAEVLLVPNRKFRFDYVHLPSKTAIELNGGLYSRGRHSRGIGQEKDYEKALLANLEGYLVINLGTNQIKAEFLEMVYKVIIQRQNGKHKATSID